MHKLNVLAFIFCSLIIVVLSSYPLGALSNNLVISQIKVGNSSSNRLIEIYNNSVEPIDITGWCLYYSSPNNTLPYTNLGCIVGSNPSTYEFITGRSYILFASTQPGITADITVSSGLGNGTSGHAYLYDSSGNEVDRVGWGTAINPETQPIVLDSTKVIERKSDSPTDTLIDTDNNMADFFNSVLRTQYQYGSIYEVADICANIPGIQQTIPGGYTSDDQGNCNLPPVDVCMNLEDIQTVPPYGHILDESGDCIKDACMNIEGLQYFIPDGYKLKNESECIVDLKPLMITELLPNADGSDDGNEFIEIYNPNEVGIDLGYYILHIENSNKDYYFPAGVHINAGEYMSFSNDDIQFTLVNTSGGAGLYSIYGELINDVPVYENPKDDTAWALINGSWQYTNKPTPGLANEASTISASATKSIKSKLVPCAPNQYRNPETNRCKLIEPSTSKLVPCKEGQYRSEETNRCRSIAAVLGASTLKPCKEGQERNPITNRCRNIVGSMPKADYAPEKTDEQENYPVVWWSLAGLGLLAVGYGVWEWRSEIKNIFMKVKP